MCTLQEAYYNSFIVLPENKKKVSFIHLHQSQNNNVKLTALLGILICINGPLGSENPLLGRLCVCVDPLFPYHMTVARWELAPPPFIWRAWLPILIDFWALFHRYPESLSHGLVISLIGSHSSSFSSTPTTLSPKPTKERLLFFRLSLCLFFTFDFLAV